MIRGTEDKLRELELFSLKKTRLMGDLIDTFQYLRGGHRKDREGLFTKTFRIRQEIVMILY